MQHARALNTTDQADQPSANQPAQPPVPVKVPTVWVTRITGIIGVIFLASAFTLWIARHGHYRLILLLLTVAMFMAILHSYTFENGSR